MPFGPALPKGVRTPSTKTTSRSERDMGPPRSFELRRRVARRSSSYPSVTSLARPTRRPLVVVPRTEVVRITVRQRIHRVLAVTAQPEQTDPPELVHNPNEMAGKHGATEHPGDDRDRGRPRFRADRLWR